MTPQIITRQPTSPPHTAPLTNGHDPTGAVLAWCAGCREQTEFVAPVGLRDAAEDELACLQCGWAVLVVLADPASVHLAA